jgi:uncharacterized protein YjiS (DUF1127 family)
MLDAEYSKEGVMAHVTFGSLSNLPRPDFLTRVSAVASTWQRRARQRAELAHLGDLELHDLAISPSEAELEISKPFWRG